MFSHFKRSMFQDNTPNELYHLDGPWDVKLPAFEFVLFYLFPHLTLERKRDFQADSASCFYLDPHVSFTQQKNSTFLSIRESLRLAKCKNSRIFPLAKVSAPKVHKGSNLISKC